MQQSPITIFWFRRDLRLVDNTSLYYACQKAYPVQPIFIFDSNILDKIKEKKDGRVEFIHHRLMQLAKELREQGGTLDIRIGNPVDIWKKLLEEYTIKTVWANKDYEPYARVRDKTIYELLKGRGITFRSKKDHVLFEKNEIVKEDGKPYLVYTPYSKKWKNKLQNTELHTHNSEKISNWFQREPKEVPSLKEVGFKPTEFQFSEGQLNEKLVKTYDKTRNFPAIQGTSNMSLYLRFGTVSIRSLVQKALILNESYLNELIWRDFYQAILWHFPEVVSENFNKKYDGINWRNNEKEFDVWKHGKTGYPIVDAGMRELHKTGFMHNRVRMIVSSFLTKHLLIDWRWGEAYFSEKLLDYELASNNGGWQWAAGTGVDAQPYFRIFNPYSQTDKFDQNKEYINKWVTELGTNDYPNPIVEHTFARKRCLETYKAGIR